MVVAQNREGSSKHVKKLRLSPAEITDSFNRKSAVVEIAKVNHCCCEFEKILEAKEFKIICSRCDEGLLLRYIIQLAWFSG